MIGSGEFSVPDSQRPLTAPETTSEIAPEYPAGRHIRPAVQLFLLAAVAGLMFFAGLGQLPLLEPDEGRNAEVAREMLVAGDWITPHYNSFVYLDKPAVFFWMVAGSLRAFGVSEAAARLPSALMGVATLLLVWFLARRMFGESAGLAAGIICATCPLTIAFSREVIFDMTLTFFVTLAFVAFWLAEHTDEVWTDLLMFAALGLAVITKGPVGVLLPAGAWLIYRFTGARKEKSRHLHWGWGILIFLVIALPWFVAVSLRNPDFPRYAFWTESLKRFSTGSVHRGGGIFYYLPVFLGGFFPWSLFLLLAGWNRVRRWRELRQPQARAVLYLLCWAIWVFAFFTLSRSKLPGYFLPAVVPLSILVAAAWRDVGKNMQARSPDWLTAGFALLLGLGILVAGASHSWVYASIQTHLGKKFSSVAAGMIKPSLLYSGLILAALGIIGRNLASRRRGRVLAGGTLLLAAATVPLLVVRCSLPIRLYAESESSRRLANTILASPLQQAPVFGYYYFRSSLPFYLQRPVGLVSVEWGEMTSNYQVTRQAEARRAGASNPGKGLLVTVGEFQTLARSAAQPMLVMTPNSLVSNLVGNIGTVEPLWSEKAYSVWEIRPATPPAVAPARGAGPFQP